MDKINNWVDVVASINYDTSNNAKFEFLKNQYLDYSERYLGNRMFPMSDKVLGIESITPKVDQVQPIVQFLEPSMEVLDIGCSIGAQEYYIANKVKHITAIDNDLASYGFAQICKVLHQERDNKSYSNIEFIWDDFYKFKTDKKFDCILALNISQIINSNKDQFYNRLDTLLAKDGFILFTDFWDSLVDDNLKNNYNYKILNHNTEIKVIDFVAQRKNN